MILINYNFVVTNTSSTDLRIYLLMKKIHPGYRQRLYYKLCIPIDVLNFVCFNQMCLSKTIQLCLMSFLYEDTYDNLKDKTVKHMHVKFDTWFKKYE